MRGVWYETRFRRRYYGYVNNFKRREVVETVTKREQDKSGDVYEEKVVIYGTA